MNESLPRGPTRTYLMTREVSLLSREGNLYRLEIETLA